MEETESTVASTPDICFQVQVDQNPVLFFDAECAEQSNYLAKSKGRFHIPIRGSNPAFVRMNVLCLSGTRVLYGFQVGWNDIGNAINNNDNDSESEVICFGERHPWIENVRREEDMEPRFYMRVSLAREIGRIIFTDFVLSFGDLLDLRHLLDET